MERTKSRGCNRRKGNAAPRCGNNRRQALRRLEIAARTGSFIAHRVEQRRAQIDESSGKCALRCHGRIIFRPARDHAMKKGQFMRECTRPDFHPFCRRFSRFALSGRNVWRIMLSGCLSGVSPRGSGVVRVTERIENSSSVSALLGRQPESGMVTFPCRQAWFFARGALSSRAAQCFPHCGWQSNFICRAGFPPEMFHAATPLVTVAAPARQLEIVPVIGSTPGRGDNVISLQVSCPEMFIASAAISFPSAVKFLEPCSWLANVLHVCTVRNIRSGHDFLQ